MAADVDVLVLGGGNAGVAAASAAAKAGRAVALVEARDLGGTCPLRGCVPKKVLVAAAETLETVARAGAHRIAVGPARLDWAGLIERKQGFVEGVPEEMRKTLEERGVEVVDGRARFVGPTAVAVDERRIEARKVVVATGSKPRPLPFEGAEHLVTSDEILDRREQPRSLAFVGAGVIALEFTHVFARAGTRVTLLEAMERPLGPLDADAVAKVVEATRDLGVEIETNVRVASVRRRDGGFAVAWERQGEERRLEAGLVAHGAGRVPDLEALDLAAAGIALEKGRVDLDPYLRSVENPDVLFAGDSLAATPQLSPLATYEGRIAGANAVARSEEELAVPEYAWIPQCVFTIPALAAVGRTEEEARRAGLDVDVRVHDMSGWRSGRTYAETVAWAKILVDRRDDRILGAHLVGHGAQETVHPFALAIRHDLRAADLASFVYAYPTFSSDIKHLL